ncbi:MAG: hypothetical protein QXP70_02875 [Methanomassiliicoccales archaeon]
MPSPVERLVRQHDGWRSGRCINLQPSENILSHAVRMLLSTDMASRYTLQSSEFVDNGGATNSYGGTRYMDDVERLGEEFAKEVFRARFASLKPLSGHIASMLMISTVCSKGDTIMAVQSADGGYDGYGPNYLADIFSLNFKPLPFDWQSFTIDSDKAAEQIIAIKPRLVILGQSFFLFPYNMGPIREACDDAGAFLGYDASHVLGLVAGGEFQDPLGEGADIVLGSTHKSFPGPQGGIFLTNDRELFRGFQRNLTWRLIDNAHWNRIAAMSQALYEMKRYGRKYAERVVANSHYLGRALEGKLSCMFSEKGYSASHQLLIDKAALAEKGFSPATLSATLEKNDIIVDTTGRLGTAEITRLGMLSRDVKAVASLISEAIEGKMVKGKTNKLRRRFKVRYA